MRRFALPLALLALASCDDPQGRGAGAERVSVSGRPDLELSLFRVDVQNGTTDFVPLQVGEQSQSMLVELRGQQPGWYFMDEFYTPDNFELSQSGFFVTRDTFEVPGLANFLFPNDGVNVVQPGTYGVSFRGYGEFDYGSNSVSQPLSGDALDGRVYFVNRDLSDSCGLHLDFLVDYEAVGDESFELAIDLLIEKMDPMFRQVGIAIIDYQFQRVDLQSPDLNLGDGSVLGVADNVLDQGRAAGAVRQDAMHIVFVRQIGGRSDDSFDPNGYSMGLPGPYDADRPNSTVFVASKHYVEQVVETGELVLDVDGMATSLAHELGHFLGLYHTSEKNGERHDTLDDTPECQSSSACSDEFRTNIMTSAFWLSGAGKDPSIRQVFTPEQGRVMRAHPLCVPYAVEYDDGKEVTCDAECTSPMTCVLIDDIAGCALACDPLDEQPCEVGECAPDDRGTYACQ